MEGEKPDANGRAGGNGGELTGEEVNAVVVIADKGKGWDGVKDKETVDVFYFYFWGYNFGGVVLGKDLGHHVGDW